MFADGGHDILTRQQRLCSERTADVVIVQSGVEQRQLARRVPQAGDIRRLQEIDGDLDAFEDVKEGRARGRALKGSRQGSERPSLATERGFPRLPGSNILQLSWCRRRLPRTAASV